MNRSGVHAGVHRGVLRTVRVLLLGVALNSSCAGDIAPSRTDLELRLPVRGGFESVADAIQPSCGTLDCHGQATRNLRLFGGRGLRLEDKATSDDDETTPAEYDADYWAIAALEPEALSVVLEDDGNDPERLIFVRKGRGTSAHKGGALMRPGGDLDQCILDWLRGTILVDRCRAAARITGFKMP